jgi:hypothetical protein
MVSRTHFKTGPGSVGVHQTRWHRSHMSSRIDKDLDGPLRPAHLISPRFVSERSCSPSLRDESGMSFRNLCLDIDRDHPTVSSLECAVNETDCVKFVPVTERQCRFDRDEAGMLSSTYGLFDIRRAATGGYFHIRESCQELRLENGKD